jgi:hypothetical protein
MIPTAHGKWIAEITTAKYGKFLFPVVGWAIVKGHSEENDLTYETLIDAVVLGQEGEPMTLRSIYAKPGDSAIIRACDDSDYARTVIWWCCGCGIGGARSG